MKGVNVQIMGQSLTVASEAGDDWVKSLAETVDEKIKDIRAGSQTINSVKPGDPGCVKISPRNSNTCVASIKSWWIELRR